VCAGWCVEKKTTSSRCDGLYTYSTFSGHLTCSKYYPRFVPTQKEPSEEHRTINVLLTWGASKNGLISLFLNSRDLLNVCLSLQNNLKSIKVKSWWCISKPWKEWDYQVEKRRWTRECWPSCDNERLEVTKEHLTSDLGFLQDIRPSGGDSWSQSGNKSLRRRSSQAERVGGCFKTCLLGMKQEEKRDRETASTIPSSMFNVDQHHYEISSLERTCLHKHSICQGHTTNHSQNHINCHTAATVGLLQLGYSSGGSFEWT
jgi:hypothetical protein